MKFAYYATHSTTVGDVIQRTLDVYVELYSFINVGRSARIRCIVLMLVHSFCVYFLPAISVCVCLFRRGVIKFDQPAMKRQQNVLQLQLCG